MTTTDKVTSQLEANTDNTEAMKLGGVFKFECFDKDGNLKWTEEDHNLVVDTGLNSILDVYFHAATQITTWYVGLKGAGTIAVGDTLASHSGWSEITDYTGDRKEYVEAAASGKSITNSASPASFSIDGTATVAGAFLCSVATTTSGTLFSAIDFAASRSVASGDTLNVSYTFTSADA